MSGSFLGKITRAEYGMIGDYPFLFGLILDFKIGDGGGIGCGGKYTVNLSNKCNWDTSDGRRNSIEKHIDFVNKILKDAHVCYVSELKNKPVEITIKDNTFVDFRILTEVL